MTAILYLIGKSGTGKYTIATEVAKHGYKICDNQLINHAIFSLLDYDGLIPIPKYAWRAIKSIRNNIFKFLTHEHNNNYILTNVLGNIKRDHEIFKKVEHIALSRQSVFVPVILTISKDENIKRIENKDRLLKYKSIDSSDVINQSLIEIEHNHLLTLDVTDLKACDAAGIILAHVKGIRNDRAF